MLYNSNMLKRSVEKLIQRYNDANAYDPRLDPKGTGWYFPGQWNMSDDPVPLTIEGSNLDADEMVELIEEGIARTEREMASQSQKIASAALNDTVELPGHK